MIELEADLWSVPADAIVVTTNGFVKRNGEAVMGRGCAKEAHSRGLLTQGMLGQRLRERGNHVFVFPHRLLDSDREPGGRRYTDLVSFPVKVNWNEPAMLGLIVQSCEELRIVANALNWKTVVMPRPGCGNGQLNWDTVRPMVKARLDDRFTVVTFPVESLEV